MKTPEFADEFLSTVRKLKDDLSLSIAAIEAENPDIRPLGPFTKNEAVEAFCTYIALAQVRTLTRNEGFQMGQLLDCFGKACEAEVLGHKGRVWVLTEEQINAFITTTGEEDR